MTDREVISGDGDRLSPGARAEVAEQFARYRAYGLVDARFDECGRPAESHYDELVDGTGRMRSMWSELSADFIEQGVAGLARIDHRVRRQLEDDGLTSLAADEDSPRPWQLDPIPLLVSAEDWAQLETGLVQRSQVLDEVLTDVYGPRRLLSSGLLPPQIVFGHTGYVRAAHGITIPGTRQLFLHACDLSRWSDGRFRVLADRAQVPSGVGYALADRRVVATAIPEAFEHASPRPLTPFTRAVRSMLAEAAPEPADGAEPTVVVWSPGSRSPDAFDYAYLAQMLGFPLVESADLVVRDGALWMRSLGSFERVDVVLRGVDAQSCDPLDLRPDSRTGVVGLVEVLRRGAVTVVNTLGSGLLESPALSAFLPRIARAVLDTDLLLDGVPAYWGGDEVERAHLVSHVGELVLCSAVDGSTIMGPRLSRAEREEFAARIDAETWKWVGREPAEFSVAPAVEGQAELAPAPVGMRMFALAARGGYTAMPGGLGQQQRRRAASREVVEVAAKDVWVRAVPATAPAVGVGAQAAQRPSRAAPMIEAISSPRVLSDLFRMGRYSERAETVVRALAATYEVYQEYHHRPWLDGAEALPILMRALSVLTGTVAPGSVLPKGRPTALVPVHGRIEAIPDDPRSERPTPAQWTEAAKPGGGGGVRRAAAGVSDDGLRYLSTLTGDRHLTGSLADAVNQYGRAARAVRDQVSADTWMILAAVDRALGEFREAGAEQEGALSSAHSLISAALLSLSGIGAESLVRDTGWYVMDIGKRIERGLAVSALLNDALARTGAPEVERVVADAVLVATESAVSYRRRHGDPAQLAALADLLLFDANNPRSLIYQLDRLEADFRALPGGEVASRAQRLLADAQRMLRRVDPVDLEYADDEGVRTELVELLEGVHLRLCKLSESFEATRLSVPQDIQLLGGDAGRAG
ncbi:circularly permuted type 2 ATP-grasp protein [Nocardia halotolerans]|uniref:Circularly permuted type 2 ATP-grasp protein n=1 Tax=Nocardia halotolerans TaxID=1755878 RepID=A0ABV8VPI2_9NOCA